MTLKQLQRYLETEKWRETAKRGVDVCGNYPRCAYCNHYDEYPCAEAYNRYASAPVKEESEGLLPEPPARRVFGQETERAETAPRAEHTAPAHKCEGIPVQRFVRRAELRGSDTVVPVPPVQPTVPEQVWEEKKGGVLARSARDGEKTRVLFITRKKNLN